MKALILVAAFIFTSFAIAAMPENPTDHIVKAMNVLNDQDLKCQADNDCNTLAYGSKACGGPNGFIVTSDKNSKINQIENLAQISEHIEADYNRENDINSTCEQILAPPVKCIQNKCLEAW